MGLQMESERLLLECVSGLTHLHCRDVSLLAEASPLGAESRRLASPPLVGHKTPQNQIGRSVAVSIFQEAVDPIRYPCMTS